MSVLTQRLVGNLRLPNGGWTHFYDVLDGDAVVGAKTMHKVSRDVAPAVSYQLGDDVFTDAAAFIAAYQARRSAA